MTHDWKLAWTPTDDGQGAVVEDQLREVGAAYLVATVDGVRCIAPLGTSFPPDLSVQAVDAPAGYVARPDPDNAEHDQLQRGGDTTS